MDTFLPRPTRAARRQPSALVAAANPTKTRRSSSALEKIPEFKSRQLAEVKRWQVEAFDAVEAIGELRYAIYKKADVLSRGAFRVMEPDPDGIDPDEDLIASENEAALQVMRELLPPPGTPGGRRGMIRRAAQHLEVCGETYLVAEPLTPDARKATGRMHGWEFLSPVEFKTDTDGSKPKRSYGGWAADAEFDVNGYAARVWRPDARYSDRPDCALRSCLGPARQVMLLSDLVDAAGETKLAAPALLLPDELDLADRSGSEIEAGWAPGVEDPTTEFLRDLLRHLTDPVQDPKSGARWAPLLIRGPAEFLKEVRTLELGRNIDGYAAELRSEALQRLARGLDIPPEVMEGMGDTNHWSIYGVSADFLNQHVIPLGELIAEFLTEAYLRVRLRAGKADGGHGMSADEAAKYRVVYDPSKITARNDESANFQQLHANRLISDDAVRRANGAGNEDAPDDDERRRRFLEEFVALAPDVILPKLAEEYGVEWSEEDTEAMKQSQQPPPEEAPVEEDPVEDAEAPSDENPDEAMDEPEPPDEVVASGRVLIERLTVAGHHALERALERAANRMVSLAQRKDTIRSRLAHVPTLEIPSALSKVEMAALSTNEDELLAGAWDRLHAQARPWVRAYLLAHGESPLAADDKAAMAITMFAEELDRIARSAFDRPVPLGPNLLRVPESVAVRALTSVAAVRV